MLLLAEEAGDFYAICPFRNSASKSGLVAEEQAQKRTRLALGVEGGFALDETEFSLEEHYNLVVLPSWEVIPLPTDLPDCIQRSIQGVKEADSARKMAELEAASWDGGFR